MNRSELHKLRKTLSQNEETTMLLDHIGDCLKQMDKLVKYRLTESELKLVDEIEERTSTNYEVDNDRYICVSNLICIIYDLWCEIEHLEEEYEDLENDLRDNYEPRYKTPYEEYGVSEKDFY